VSLPFGYRDAARREPMDEAPRMPFRGAPAPVPEVEMLDKDERETLRVIERQISAADPDLAALLRGERGLPGTAKRTCMRAALGLLVLLTVMLLALGLPAGALAVAAVTAGLWRMWRHHVARPTGSGRRRRS
jgi:hypothetical protein